MENWEFDLGVLVMGSAFGLGFGYIAGSFWLGVTITLLFCGGAIIVAGSQIGKQMRGIE